nr:hypothetical protein [Tanacetum cinerariifolium]
MKIPDWMITDEIKLTENYRLYAKVFGVEVPTTQSHPIKSTQGMHRQLAPLGHQTLLLLKENQVIHEEQKSHEEDEARENVEKVKKHFMTEEIDKLVDETENVEENGEADSFTLTNDDNPNDPGTRIEPMSDKESPEVEKIIDISQPVNVIEEEEESAEDDYELRRREKRKHELTVTDPQPSSSTPSSSSPKSKISASNRLLSLFKSKHFMPRRNFNEIAHRLQEIMLDSLPKLVDDRIKRILKTQVPLHVAQGLILEREKSQTKVAKIIVDAIQQECENLRTEISSQVNDAVANHIPSQVDSSVKSYMSGHILHVRPTKDTPTSTQDQQYQLYLTMRNNPQLQKDYVSIWLALKIKFKRVQVATTPCRPSAVRPRDQDDPYDDAHLEGENGLKRQKTSEHETFLFGESSSAQDYESEPVSSTSGNQHQLDDIDFWTNSYATYDDELPTEKVSQEIMKELSQTVDEAKLHKVESMKEILVSPHPQRPTIFVQSCQRDSNAPALSLINQDLLYFKKGSSGPEKIVMSLYKFPVVIFPDDNIEKKTSRWVKKCLKKFNPYARYNVEH